MQEANTKPEQILAFFKQEFPALKNVCLKDMGPGKGKDFQGFAEFTFETGFVEKGKTRERKVKPYGILLNRKLQHANYVLIHQISHCITPYVERKHEDSWIKVDHDRQFYNNLFSLIEKANKAGLFHKKFDSVSHLMTYDKSV